jgi:predicted transcriptional regulator
VYGPTQAAPLTHAQFWISVLVSANLMMMPAICWWGVSKKWRVTLTLKSGSLVRSAQMDNWAKADAFAKAARQA